MQATDDLFQLIKALNDADKKKFSLYASQQGGNKPKKYLILYNELKTQEIYDEQQIKAKLRDKIKNFADTKSHLFSLILLSLRTQPTRKRQEKDRITDFIEDARVLDHYRLKEKSREYLVRAKDLAWKYEDFPNLLKIIHWECKEVRFAQKKGYEETLRALWREKSKVLEFLSCEFNYMKLKDELFLIMRRENAPREQEIEALLVKYENNVLLKDSQNALTFESKHNYFFTWSILHQLKGNSQQYFRDNEQIIQHWEQYPHFQKALIHEYNNVLTNYLNSCKAIGRYDLFPEILEKIEAAELTGTQREKVSAWLNSKYLRLLFYLDQHQIGQALKLIETFVPKLEKHGEYVHPSFRLTYYYNIMTAHFLGEHFDEAQKWNERILALNNVETRRDIRLFTPVLKAIIRFEQTLKAPDPDWELFESEFRSAYRKIKRISPLLPFEKILFSYLRAILRKLKHLPDHSLRLFEVILPMEKELEQFRASRKGPVMLGLNELIIWVKARRQKKKMYEINLPPIQPLFDQTTAQ